MTPLVLFSSQDLRALDVGRSLPYPLIHAPHGASGISRGEGWKNER